jgi:hypothetical protein
MYLSSPAAGRTSLDVAAMRLSPIAVRPASAIY